ncbi:hypothetical protein GJ496_011627 [Pomphorhynchus laevis]|nr:hypothetical protein GJ496_011627 [Pomphorhynchus laevis]
MNEHLGNYEVLNDDLEVSENEMEDRDKNPVLINQLSKKSSTELNDHIHELLNVEYTLRKRINHEIMRARILCSNRNA